LFWSLVLFVALTAVAVTFFCLDTKEKKSRKKECFSPQGHTPGPLSLSLEQC
jgi:hypothetical protein